MVIIVFPTPLAVYQFRTVLTTDLSSSRPSIPGFGRALTLNVALA
jgi:hypothetical protein